MNYDRDASWNSDYDSTWEDEELEPPKKKKQKPQYQYVNRAARDMQNYRRGYGQPNLDLTTDSQDDEKFMPNLAFYQDKVPFQPSGVNIEEFLQYWWEDYEELEGNHNFIQWIFPLRERGVNYYSEPLTLREIQMMRADEDVMRRLLEAYRLMLGFYGIRLLDEETGDVCRAENWKERYRNLNNRSHNNLRITRILKCLGEMGFGHLQAPLVRFFLEETLCNNYLPNVGRSVLDYFMFTVKDKQERRKLVRYAWENYKPQEQFKWGPVEKLQILTSMQENAERQPETGGGRERKGDGDGPGVDRPGVRDDGKVVTDVHPGEAPQHEEVTTSAGNDKRRPEEKKELITADNSSRIEKQAPEESEKLITEDIELLTTENNSPRNDRHTPEDKEKLITEDNRLRNEKQIPADNSSGNEKQIEAANNSGNEKQTPVGNSSGKEKLITQDTSTGNAKLITEDNSSGKEMPITENTSSENEKQTQEDNSLVNERLITEGTSTENQKQTQEDNSLGNEKQIIKDNSLGNERLITEGTSTANEGLTTGDCSTRKEQTTESTSCMNLRQTLGDTNLGNEKLTTEGTSSGNKNTTTGGTSSGNKNMTTESTSSGNKNMTTESTSSGNKNMTTGGTSLENKAQSGQSGLHQAENPQSEEAQKLLSGDGAAAGEPSICDRILSLYGCCCYICCCAH
ncbi:opioid growth factor receptor-like [Eleutherodactylus coqui]|uniref:opioid growth factor receptor-like n=1 Tax=Eleutherodactylus coqui TaxID=57060 RepID=UPI00346287C0